MSWAKKRCWQPWAKHFWHKDFCFCFILESDTENELGFVVVSSFLFIFNFFSDGIFQISVTNIDHPTDFKPVWLFYLRWGTWPSIKVKPNYIKSSMGQKLKLSFENQVPPSFSFHNKMASYLVTLALTLPCLVFGVTWVERKMELATVQSL